MSDAPGSFSVGLRSRLLPEDRRLGESHDLAEAPRIGYVERPVLPFELPGLHGGVLRQCPFRFAKGLSESLAPLALAATGLRHSGIGHGIDRRHRAGIGRAVEPGRFFFVSKPSTFGKVSETRIGSFVSGKTTRASHEGFWQPGYLSQRIRVWVRRLHASTALITAGGRCSKSCPTTEEVIVDKPGDLEGARQTFHNSGLGRGDSHSQPRGFVPYYRLSPRNTRLSHIRE